VVKGIPCVSYLFAGPPVRHFRLGDSRQTGVGEDPQEGPGCRPRRISRMGARPMLSASPAERRNAFHASQEA